MAAANDNAVKAEKAFKAGKDCIATGMFKWKPDYDGATRHFVDAAKFFRLANNQEKYIESLKLAGDAYERTDSYHLSAKNWEEAARVLEQKEPAESAKLYAKSSQLHLMNSHPDRAATNLVKAGKLVGEQDMKSCIEYFNESVSIFKDESRGKFSNDAFKGMIGYAIKRNQHEAGLALLEAQNELYIRHLDTFEQYLYRNLLSCTVMRFYLKQYTQAAEKQAEYYNIGNFAASKECEAADSMIETAKQLDHEGFQATVTQQLFTFLDNEVAVLAKRLTLDDEAAKTMAAIQGKKQDEQDPALDFT